MRAIIYGGREDPLFPATKIGVGPDGAFAPTGLSRRFWTTSEPVRQIFRHAFASAGLPYFNPHSFRSMLVRHAMSLDLTPEEMKAWSQNLGHADVLTTFTSYGIVPVHRQGELIRSTARTATWAPPDMKPEEIEALEALLMRAKSREPSLAASPNKRNRSSVATGVSAEGETPGSNIL